MRANSSKLKLTSISDKARKHKGFSGGPFGGCLHCPCGVDGKGGACCRYGCEVDGASYELLFENRDLVEAVVGTPLETCFEGPMIIDNDYLGGRYIMSNINPANGYCVFHNKTEKGCALFSLMKEKNLPARIMPAICRLYPLTWNEGHMFLYDEVVGSIEVNCDCTLVSNETRKLLIETQLEEILDIFDLDPKLLNSM